MNNHVTQENDSILGVLPSLGGSIISQQKDRREGLFLRYYIPRYLSYFDAIYYFSYANEKQCLPKNMHMFGNQLRLHRYIYALLMPILHFSKIRKCKLIRVMHLNGAIAAWVVKKLYRIPYVVTYGYNYVKFARIQGHQMRAYFLTRLIPFLLRHADKVIVTTEELDHEVKAWIGDNNKTVLIPNGVDVNYFTSNGRMKEKKPFQLLFVGRLEKQKNLFFLFNVLRELKNHCDYQMTIIGNGSQERQLEREANADRLPIHFVSRVPYESIRNYHQSADCFISTSLAEGHPKALIEAMSSGLACVVSDCPGNSGLIRHRYNGLCIETNNVQTWVDALLSIVNDPVRREELGAQARQTVIEHYDLSMTLKNEVEYLKDICESTFN